RARLRRVGAGARVDHSGGLGAAAPIQTWVGGRDRASAPAPLFDAPWAFDYASSNGIVIVDIDFGRLTQPLMRVDGKLQAPTSAATPSPAANRSTDLKARHGPDTFGCYSCSKTTNELNYLAQKFTRAVVGTNNVDSCNRT